MNVAKLLSYAKKILSDFNCAFSVIQMLSVENLDLNERYQIICSLLGALENLES